MQRVPRSIVRGVQVNFDYATSPNVGKLNSGASMITGLGNYQKGELFHHADHGDKRYKSEEDHGPGYPCGMTISGFDENEELRRT